MSNAQGPNDQRLGLRSEDWSFGHCALVIATHFLPLFLKRDSLCLFRALPHHATMLGSLKGDAPQ